MAIKYNILGGGMLGSALHRRILRDSGSVHLYTRNDIGDFRRESTFENLKSIGDGTIFLAAANVGGIQKNMLSKLEMLNDNLAIQNNVLDLWKGYDNRLVFYGSSCMYPTDITRDLVEEDLFTGRLEPTNEPYAMAKLVGLKQSMLLSEQYMAGLRGRTNSAPSLNIIPCNLYGPFDAFYAPYPHVIPQLMRRFTIAKEYSVPTIELMGTGKAIRQFMHVDDLADASIHLLKNWNTHDPINVGSDEYVTIKELAHMISEIVGYRGMITWSGDTKYDGMVRKVMDLSKLNNSNWKASTKLNEGLVSTYEWYINNYITPLRQRSELVHYFNHTEREYMLKLFPNSTGSNYFFDFKP